MRPSTFFRRANSSANDRAKEDQPGDRTRECGGAKRRGFFELISIQPGGKTGRTGCHHHPERKEAVVTLEILGFVHSLGDADQETQTPSNSIRPARGRELGTPTSRS